MTDLGAIDAGLQGLATLLGTGDPPIAPAPAPKAAAPAWPYWTGTLSDTARASSTQLDARRTNLYDTHDKAMPIINAAGQITLTARKKMDDIRAAWESDKSRWGILKYTPIGMTALLAIGQNRLNEAAGVVGNAMTSFNEAAARLTGVAGELPLAPPGGTIPPRTAQNLGPIAGTGSNGAIPGIGAADLGEIVRLPDGRLVAVFGDAYTGDRIFAGDHYRSVAVPIEGFDAQGRPIFGKPFNDPVAAGQPGSLFPPPPEAMNAYKWPPEGINTLPAGSIEMNGKTYMMVAGTKDLIPYGGTWLVEVSNDPSQGWKPVPNSWRPYTPGQTAPTQISGYQSSQDGMVYIAADQFDRSQGVSMYRVDPSQILNRDQWQPWNGSSWGGTPQVLSGNAPFGELSFREVDGRPVLSGFNNTPGQWQVEVRVGSTPTDVLAGTPLIAAQNAPGPNHVTQPYGGFIMPGSTLDDLNLIISQWDTSPAANGSPYNSQQVIVNTTPP